MPSLIDMTCSAEDANNLHLVGERLVPGALPVPEDGRTAKFLGAEFSVGQCRTQWAVAVSPGVQIYLLGAHLTSALADVGLGS